MNASDLNSDDVSAAMSLLNTAAADLKNRLSAKGYDKAHTSVSGYGFSVWPEGLNGAYKPHIDRLQISFSKALAHIDALPDVPIWTPSLCEQTLGVGRAA